MQASFTKDQRDALSKMGLPSDISLFLAMSPQDRGAARTMIKDEIVFAGCEDDDQILSEYGMALQGALATMHSAELASRSSSILS